MCLARHTPDAGLFLEFSFELKFHRPHLKSTRHVIFLLLPLPVDPSIIRLDLWTVFLSIFRPSHVGCFKLHHKCVSFPSLPSCVKRNVNMKVKYPSNISSISLHKKGGVSIFVQAFFFCLYAVVLYK